MNKYGQNFYQIITCKDSFTVYHNKLDPLFDGTIKSYEQIVSLEFNKAATCFYIGSSSARLYKYNIEAKDLEGEPLEIDIG